MQSQFRTQRYNFLLLADENDGNAEATNVGGIVGGVVGGIAAIVLVGVVVFLVTAVWIMKKVSSLLHVTQWANIVILKSLITLVHVDHCVALDNQYALVVCTCGTYVCGIFHHVTV